MDPLLNIASYFRNFGCTEYPILLLLVVVRNCTIYVHKINERKMYVPTLSSDYEIRIKYKYNIIDVSKPTFLSFVNI